MTDSADMTIKDVRVTVLRMPWANPEWIKGHALGSLHRGFDRTNDGLHSTQVGRSGAGQIVPKSSRSRG